MGKHSWLLQMLIVCLIQINWNIFLNKRRLLLLILGWLLLNLRWLWISHDILLWRNVLLLTLHILWLLNLRNISLQITTSNIAWMWYIRLWHTIWWRILINRTRQLFHVWNNIRWRWHLKLAKSWLWDNRWCNHLRLMLRHIDNVGHKLYKQRNRWCWCYITHAPSHGLRINWWRIIWHSYGPSW